MTTIARPVALAATGLAAVAWSVLVWAPPAHAGHGSAHGTVWPAVTAFAVMVVAMMLPPALPMFTMLRGLVARRRRPTALLGAGAGAFVAVWTAAGVLLVVGDGVVQVVIGRTPWLAAHPEPLTGLVLVGAGLYQFSPLKDACLRACRTPRGFAVAHWRGVRSPSAEAATLAGAYAVSCVGCCWALMAVSFAVGAAALPAMVLLAVVMASERLLPWGRALVRPVGVAALVAGVVLVLVPVVSA